jgi:MFS family permease
MLIKRYKPSVFLTGCLFFWGICMTAQGLVSNPAGLYVARFFLGVTEAALFPVSCFFFEPAFFLSKRCRE